MRHLDKVMSNHSDYTGTTWLIEFNKATSAFSNELMRIFGNRIRQLTFEFDDDTQLAEQVAKAFYAVKKAAYTQHGLELYGD
jgi:hypothetical protein